MFSLYEYRWKYLSCIRFSFPFSPLGIHSKYLTSMIPKLNWICFQQNVRIKVWVAYTIPMALLRWGHLHVFWYWPMKVLIKTQCFDIHSFGNPWCGVSRAGRTQESSGWYDVLPKIRRGEDKVSSKSSLHGWHFVIVTVATKQQFTVNNHASTWWSSLPPPHPPQ